MLPILHFMNEMLGRFLAYEGPIGEDMAFAGRAATCGLCEFGGQWGQVHRNQTLVAGGGGSMKSFRG